MEPTGRIIACEQSGDRPGARTGRSCARPNPELIRQEHAAWATATELVRAATRSAAAIATPSAKVLAPGSPSPPGTCRSPPLAAP